MNLKKEICTGVFIENIPIAALTEYRKKYFETRLYCRDYILVLPMYYKSRKQLDSNIQAKMLKWHDSIITKYLLNKQIKMFPRNKK